MAKKRVKKQVGRPTTPLPQLNVKPEALAKELLKQRPLREVEKDRKRGDG